AAAEDVPAPASMIWHHTRQRRAIRLRGARRYPDPGREPLMGQPSSPTPSSVEGEELLESLGYRQELKRGLNVLGNLALVVSDITPTASLLIVGTVVILGAGTGSVWAYLIGCFLAINVALCMAELGSMYPVAGGLFSIVTR